MQPLATMAESLAYHLLRLIAIAASNRRNQAISLIGRDHPTTAPRLRPSESPRYTWDLHRRPCIGGICTAIYTSPMGLDGQVVLADPGRAAWPSSTRPEIMPIAKGSNRIEELCRLFLFGCRAQEVMVLRSRVLAILLTSTCILSGVAASASPVAVRYKEGLIHGFLMLSTLDGEAIAAGDLTQVAHGDHVTTQLAFRFKDGSRQEETTVFSQRGNFRLISYHMVQKGPSFKNASDLSVTCATGQVTVRYTDDDGKEKVVNQHFALPPDLGNGLIPMLLMNMREGTPQIEIPMVVAAPKPRLVKIVVNAQGTEPFSLGGFSREAKHYVAKVDLGGVAGVVAPMVGKQPPDSQIWVLGGEAPVFLKCEVLSYAGGPMWRMELASPDWPRTSAADSKKGTASKD